MGGKVTTMYRPAEGCNTIPCWSAGISCWVILQQTSSSWPVPTHRPLLWYRLTRPSEGQLCESWRWLWPNSGELVSKPAYCVTKPLFFLETSYAVFAQIRLMLYSETSLHRSHMHFFHASIIHFFWSLYIACINNFSTFIVYFSQPLQKQWTEVSLYNL
jgi:hypothetical protein